MLNNMIVNNVAGLATGGIALQDATRVFIINNTIAHNDGTGTAGAASSYDSSNVLEGDSTVVFRRSYFNAKPAFETVQLD